MKTPTDNPRRPSRPTRRFSAMQPAAARRKVEEAAAGDDAPTDGEAGEPAERLPASVVESAAAMPDEALVASPKADKPAGKKEGAKRAPTEASPAKAAAAQDKSDESRVAKVMSRAGLCSRRDAEAWILAGRVAVNGVVIESPALNVGPGDQVMVDGYPIDKPEHTRLFMFHKTRGLVTTARDPEGRATIYDALPDDLPRLMTIGRLDINTEGLLLLTNDGGLARLLELPATGWLRRYRVRANGRVDQSQLDALAKGVTVEGVDYAGIDAKLDRIQGANLWLTLGLREGKNREVKRVLEHLGLAVTRLIRISFGPFQLGDLAENAVEEVRTRILRDQLGTALAKQAGLDFGPAEPEVPRETAAAVPADPRRTTSRSATADRKGRPVPVERITSVGRPAAAARSAPGDRPVGRKPPRATAGTRDAEARPARGAERGERFDRGEQRPERSGARADARPARTLRQSDTDYPKREAGPRRDTRGGERDARPGTRDGQRRDAPRGAGERAERPAFRGRTEDRGDGRRENTSRPRTGRVDDRPRTGRVDDRPRTGRVDDRSREGRGDGPRSFSPRGTGKGGFGGGGKGGGAGGQREGAAPRRPGGKPPFKGGGDRPDGGKPRTPGGSGRGRPRG